LKIIGRGHHVDAPSDAKSNFMKSFALIVALSLLASNVRGELPAIIPRDVLFGNPERISPALSPDGVSLAWIAPDPEKTLQIWLQTIGKNDERVITKAKNRGIRECFWAMDNHTLLFKQDNNGDQNFHLYGLNVINQAVRDYTPLQGVRVDWVCLDPAFPNELLVSLNVRERAFFDVYRLDLRSGALVLDTENPGDVSAWFADPALRIRMAQIATPDGGTEIRVRSDEKHPWETTLIAKPDELVDALGFAPDGLSIYLTSSIGRDTSAVVQRNIATGVEKLIAANDEVDPSDVQIDPRRHVIEAIAFCPGRTVLEVVDPAVKEDYAGLSRLEDGDFTILDRSQRIWLVGFSSDRIAGFERKPGHFYLWDRKTKKGTFLFASRPELDGKTLAPMKPVVIPTRDGLKMPGDLTLPLGVPPKALPLILYPHGGPWERDKWGYYGNVQWLANRGYAVLQPDFRGSLGYGKKYLFAGNKEWSLKMHDDLLDAVNWAIKEGLADPLRVGIVGGSYGGYCVLNAVTRSSDVFACAADICGPSNLRTVIASFPIYWKPMRSLVDARVANIDDPKDAELIRHASPLNFADQIRRPLFIAQGGNDPCVHQTESEQMVAAIKANHGAVTYVLYPDEGHGLSRIENRLDLSARTEAFFGKFLGGRVEPMAGERLPGSTAIIQVIGQ
jgi:dipeptidyl aminopeptidase/acylaminoacyl peptidase